LVRGQDKNETYLKEVECSWSNLRSQAVFILVKRGKIYLWVGRHAVSHQKEMGEQAGKRLASQLPKEMGLGESATFLTVQSGAEAQDMLTALGGRREQINRLFDEDVPLASTPRLFHMTSVLGQFEVAEVVSDQLRLDVPNPLLYTQHILYSAEQPALYMMDCWDTIWVWQGWIQPDSAVGSETAGAGTTTGSGEVRWHAERRAAMASAQEYRRVVRREEKKRGEVELRLVWAGHEPQRFINYFPEWSVNEDVSYYNMQSTDTRTFETIYFELSRTEFSLEELQTRPLPPGVDPSRIEQYLADRTFQVNFNMTKAEYAAAPRWKQIEQKKNIGLF
jgi:supervillin